MKSFFNIPKHIFVTSTAEKTPDGIKYYNYSQDEELLSSNIHYIVDAIVYTTQKDNDGEVHQTHHDLFTFYVTTPYYSLKNAINIVSQYLKRIINTEIQSFEITKIEKQ